MFGPAKVCAYTKLYYCDECHVDERSVIPAKIVYSWNFQLFKVKDLLKDSASYLVTTNANELFQAKTD